MYIDDVLSINNPNFANWIPLIYHKELEIELGNNRISFLYLVSCHLPKIGHKW